MGTNDDRFWQEALKRSAGLRRLPDGCAQFRDRPRLTPDAHLLRDRGDSWRELKSQVWADP